MIRGTDLMIGDWISYGGKPVQVLQLSRTEYEGFEPIPLTPEILEKNGWSLWEIEGEYRQKDAIVLYGRSAPFLALDGAVLINYVHELQRVLRCCGVDKKITV